LGNIASENANWYPLRQEMLERVSDPIESDTRSTLLICRNFETQSGAASPGNALAESASEPHPVSGLHLAFAAPSNRMNPDALLFDVEPLSARRETTLP